MRRRLTEPERRHAVAHERELADGTGVDAAAARVPAAHRRTRPALAGAAASLPLNLLLSEAANQRGARGEAAQPAERADRPLRDPDDGEPLLRPLLRLAAERRRGAGRAPTRTPTTAARRSTPGMRRRSARPSGRAAGIRTRTTPGAAAARSSAAPGSTRPASPTASWPATATSSRSATTTRAISASSTPRAREFTIYDRFHCSLMASTWPNRYYKWSAQSGGRKDNSPPADTAGNQWETLFDRALRNNPANVPGPGC